jgi:hypothetical protein
MGLGRRLGLGWLLLGAWFLAVGCGSSPDDTTGSCDGVPAACWVRFKPEECVEGCSLGDGCGMVDCWLIRDQASCNARRACERGTDLCYPRNEVLTEDPCDPAAPRSTCDADASCHWGKVCLGEPTYCGDLLTRGRCESVPNCTWYDSPAF